MLGKRHLVVCEEITCGQREAVPERRPSARTQGFYLIKASIINRKIICCIANIALGNEDCLYTGNVAPTSDWGRAKNHVCMQWLMQQQEETDDLAIAMGVHFNVSQFNQCGAQELVRA